MGITEATAALKRARGVDADHGRHDDSADAVEHDSDAGRGEHGDSDDAQAVHTDDSGADGQHDGRPRRDPSIKWTTWPNLRAESKRDHDDRWSSLVNTMQCAAPVGRKSNSWLFTLGAFGDVTKAQHTGNDSDSACLRHRGNVIAMHGVVGDLDAGDTSDDAERARLERAGVNALIVTTFSHTPEHAKLRIVVPSAQALTIDEYRHVVAKLNAITQGQFDPKSYEAAQSFYVSGRRGNDDHVVVTTFDDPAAGVCIDELDVEPERPDDVVEGGDRRAKCAQPLPDTIGEGKRHTALASLAGSMRRRGADESTIVAALHELNTNRCRPPMPAAEVDAIARWSGRQDVGDDGQDAVDPVATARRARATFGALVRWQGQFWAWRAGAYHPVGQDTIRGAVYAMLEHEGRRKLATQTYVGNVVDALRSVCLVDDHVEPPCYLSTGEPLPAGHVVLSSGVLNLMTGEHWQGSADLFTLSALPVDYDREAGCPAWLNFLHALWPDDPESVETLQELFGYLVSGDVDHEKIFLLVGPKRSGKGTILRVLTRLLGRDNVASPTLTSLQQHFGLQPLIGRLAATVTDARLGARADQNAIAERLLSISGEDHVSIPRKHMQDYTAQLQTRFIMASNEVPRLHDTSGALASRFVPLVLTHSWYGREDRGLSGRLYAELPGILGWAMQGYRRLAERGEFRVPASAADDLRDLEDLASPVGAFVRDECETGPECECERAALYECWTRWCVEHGRTHAGTEAMFARDLRAVLPAVRNVRPRRGGARVNMYAGVRPRGGGSY